MAGCSSANESSEMPATTSESPATTSTATPTSTTEAPPPSISGTVTIRHADDWNLYPLDWPSERPEDFVLPESIQDGDGCRSSILGEATFIHEGTQVVATDSSGEIIGIGRLDDGTISGLGSEGFRVPVGIPLFELWDDFREMRVESECVFSFNIDLTHESLFYSVGIERARPEDQQDAKYTHDELESTGWVIEFVLR